VTGGAREKNRKGKKISKNKGAQGKDTLEPPYKERRGKRGERKSPKGEGNLARKNAQRNEEGKRSC